MEKMEGKKILDVTCGSKTIWFDKNNPAAVFCDKRSEDIRGIWKSGNGKSERKCVISPDVQCDFTCLPFPDNTFDCITISFGLRNVTDKDKALRSMYRVLKPGGRLLVLEFSKPIIEPLSKAYDAYSFHVLPRIGSLVANDADSYRYLAESIRMHPDQDTLKAMMQDAGFESVDYYNLTAGVVALHRGYKF